MPHTSPLYNGNISRKPETVFYTVNRLFQNNAIDTLSALMKYKLGLCIKTHHLKTLKLLLLFKPSADHHTVQHVSLYYNNIINKTASHSPWLLLP